MTDGLTAGEPPRDHRRVVDAGALGERRARRALIARWSRFGVPPVVVLVCLGAIWEVLADHNKQTIPTLGAVGSSLVDGPHFYLANAAWTLEEMVVGLGVSFVVAFSLAVLMTYVKVVERAVMPLAVVLNVTPVVSFAPGLVIVFGFSLLPRFIVTAVIVFFPFLVNSLVGLKSVDLEALEFFETLNASRREILWHLRLPSSLPFLFTAARIGVPLSLVGAVVAEFTTTGSVGGLGNQILIADQQLDLPVVYASVFCLAVIGIVTTGIVIIAERRLLRWHSAYKVDDR